MIDSNTHTFSKLVCLLAVASLSLASPLLSNRAVTELNQEATAEAHQRDAGATRAFSGVEIKTSDGQCLFVDPLSGDFRANLTPIQIAACDGSQGQSWDIITSGRHNDKAGKMLVVNTLTQACLDLNQGRKGREVTAFSCGGRADGDGQVSGDQLFTLPVDNAPFTLSTTNQEESCLVVAGGALGQTGCAQGASDQLFAIGGNGGSAAPANPVATSSSGGGTSSSSGNIITPTSTVIASPAETTTSPICILTTMVTVINSPTAQSATVKYVPTAGFADVAVPTYKLS